MIGRAPSHMWALPLEHPPDVSVLGAHPSPSQSPGGSHWQSAPHSVVRVPVCTSCVATVRRNYFGGMGGPTQTPTSSNTYSSAFSCASRPASPLPSVW
jgi:hypothetical protein